MLCGSEERSCSIVSLQFVSCLVYLLSAFVRFSANPPAPRLFFSVVSVLYLHREDGFLGREARRFRKRYGGNGRHREDGGSRKRPSRHDVGTCHDRRLRGTRVTAKARDGGGYVRIDCLSPWTVDYGYMHVQTQSRFFAAGGEERGVQAPCSVGWLCASGL